MVLTISGHDPSGGAGVQADIESIAAMGCRATSAVTCTTIQDTTNVQQIIPLPPETVAAQIRTLLDDITVRAIKIGLLGTAETANTVAAVLNDVPDIPVVLDPILAAGGGKALASEKLIDAILEKLLPRTLLITPNSTEARRLTGRSDLDSCAQDLLDGGCGAVLITGTHESLPEVTNRLYQIDQKVLSSNWSRLPESYHGSGCTLASSIAALIAGGYDLEDAVYRGQSYTWEALSHGYAPGRGQLLPDRFFPFEPEAAFRRLP
ncbi:MAG: hydroxymethylpyrimidine/phosphomethylpyrimidine kinase [Gammaproteobacteria bacterium]|nr:hydroxymethylpyrimidine/phosphomethylpyrimidine kinase [Gammaproteobacteria bacterium]